MQEANPFNGGPAIRTFRIERSLNNKITINPCVRMVCGDTSDANFPFL